MNTVTDSHDSLMDGAIHSHQAAMNAVNVTSSQSGETITVFPQISPEKRTNWQLLVSVIARALRFVDHIRLQRPQLQRRGFLFIIYEIERAEDYIIRQVQMTSYPLEYRSLMRDQRVKRSSEIFSLSPFMCRESLLIRATMRLSTSFSLNMRAPPILPNFHELSDTITQYYPDMNLHVNDYATIAQIRSRIWIISGKRAEQNAIQ